jgi:hypothetical protein
LVAAEVRLRALGLTGSQAFDALLTAVCALLGDDVELAPGVREAVGVLDLDEELDLVGLAYERFFADLFKGERGQYFTPRPLIELLLSRVGSLSGRDVLDPTCGSGGFLVCAAARGGAVRGIELDPYLARLAPLNLRLSGNVGVVRREDFFTATPRPAEVVVANPPFSVEITDRAVLDGYDLGLERRRVLSDALFVEALERWVVPGGMAALVMPWSLVVNASMQPLRDRILRSWSVDAICALPEGVFRPFGGAAGRACLLWLRREYAQDVGPLWAEVGDPGWDVRSKHLRLTSSAEIDRLRADEGWIRLPPGRWTPAAVNARGRQMESLAAVARSAVTPARRTGTVTVVDLADSDRSTGEVRVVRPSPSRSVRGARLRLQAGDVLVARMRPQLGNVAVVPDEAVDWVGSPEWVVLRPTELGYALLHALRTPEWRRRLPATEGQTRPRTTARAVLETPIPWPAEHIAVRVDALSRSLHRERRALRQRLVALQDAIDQHAAGELDDAGLEAALERLERPA